MGKGGDRGTAKRAWLLILCLIFGCSYPKPENLRYTLYSGRFLLSGPQGRRDSGRWEAIMVKGRIERVYLYSASGFPMAYLRITNGKVESNRKIPDNVKGLLLTMAVILPEALKEPNFKYKNGEISVSRDGDIITIAYRGSMLKVKVEKPPEAHEPSPGQRQDGR